MYFTEYQKKTITRWNFELYSVWRQAIRPSISLFVVQFQDPKNKLNGQLL